VTCHDHDDAPAFAAGAGTNCGDCHGFPPADNTHAAHTTTVDGDLGNEDNTDCASCHTGADLYTYDNGGDLASGVPGRQNHSAGQATQVATLLASVGYNETNQDCATACHVATTTNGGVWAAGTQLDCDACHYQAADPNQTDNSGAANTISSNSHNQHFVDGGLVDCIDCHDNVTDTTHISNAAGTEGAILLDRATADQDEALVAAALTFDDGLNTCATASCHNDARPGVDAVTPAWGVDAPNCTQCHSNAPTTGSHTVHIADAADCSTCHISALQDTSYNSTNHFDGDIDVAAGGYPNNKTVNTAFTTCGTASCHDDGRSPNVTATWGTTVNNCAECHATQPATGSHAAHLAVSGVTCGDCHTGAVEGTTAPTTGHRDDNIDVNNGSYPTNRAYTSAFTNCTTASCHNDGQGTADGTTGSSLVTTPNWGTSQACGECHAASPTSAKHDEHLGIYGAQCSDCHAGAGDGSSMPTVNHINGTIDVITDMGGNTGFDYSLGSVGMAPGDGWGTCADPTNGCHGTPEARPWDNSASSCNSCHGASGPTGAPLIAGDMISTNSLSSGGSPLQRVTLKAIPRTSLSRIGGYCVTCLRWLSVDLSFAFRQPFGRNQWMSSKSILPSRSELRHPHRVHALLCLCRLTPHSRLP
jgi:predicted CxxxxCH...CXXCH cytochrome family protein